MNESQEPVSREMWYQAQKYQADMIKRLDQKIVKLVEVVEELIKELK